MGDFRQHLHRLAVSLVSIAGVSAFLGDIVYAQDCGKICQVKAFGRKVTEPTCKLNCEARKDATRIDARLGKLWPPSALEAIEKGLNQSCALGFELMTKAVIGQCSNWNGRLDGVEQLEIAKRML